MLLVFRTVAGEEASIEEAKMLNRMIAVVRDFEILNGFMGFI